MQSDLVNAERHRTDKATAHPKQETPRVNQPCAEKGFDLERCLVEVGGRVCPDRQIQRNIEKPLGAVCDLVLQLDGIAQRRAAQGIGSSAVLVDESKR